MSQSLLVLAALLILPQSAKTEELDAGARPEGVESTAEEPAGIVADARAGLDRAATALRAGDRGTALAEGTRVLELFAPPPRNVPDIEVAPVLWDLGFLFRAGQDPARAIEAWTRALAAFERALPEDHPDLFPVRRDLGTELHRIGDLAGARALRQSALDGRERTLPVDHPDLLAPRMDLAAILREMGELHESRALQESAITSFLRTGSPDDVRLLVSRSNFSTVLRGLGELEEAHFQAEAGLAGLQRLLPADHHWVLSARGSLSSAKYALGDLPGSVALDEAVLATRERTLPADDRSIQGARLNLAVTLNGMGELERALELAEAAVAAYERTLPEDHPRLLLGRSILGSTLRQLGDDGRALHQAQAVLEGLERTFPPDHPDVLRARFDLAQAQSHVDVHEARAVFESVLADRERILPEGHPSLLATRNRLALTMMQMGDPVGARALFESVLASYESLPGDHQNVLRVRGNLANTLRAMGEHEEAHAHDAAVLAALERTKGPDDREVLMIRVSMASTRSSMGDHAEALALLMSVVADLERTLPAEDGLLMGARLNLAWQMRMTGDMAGALTLTEAVHEVLQRKHSSEHQDLLLARLRLADTLARMGDPARARTLCLEMARGMLRRLELASVLSPREAREVAAEEATRRDAVYWLTAPAPGEAPDPIRFELFETMRATSALCLGAVDEDDPRREELVDVRARLNGLVSGGRRSGQSSEDYGSEIAGLTLERDRIERALRRELAARGAAAGRIRTEDVARALPEGAAAVGFLRYDRLGLPDEEGLGPSLAAHVLHADGTLVELQLGPVAEMEELARAWRASLGRSLDARGFSSASEPASLDGQMVAGRRLRELVLDPVLDATGSAHTLYVCLDDFLHAVPIGALPLEDGGGTDLVVQDRFRLVNQVSFARLLSEQEEVSTEPTLLAVGGVAFDARPAGPRSATALASTTDRDAHGIGALQLSPLAETRGEVEFTSGLLESELEGESTLLLGAEATKSAFREQAPGKRFLHIATHGWFSAEAVPAGLGAPALGSAGWSGRDARGTVSALAPMTLCGLAFAGANLGGAAGRVPGILTAEELTGIDLSSCELAVLSACETNVGLRRAGQGVQSLQAALRAAGVRTTVTSLWKVDDALTRRLMELFYTHLWSEGLPKAEALWKAKCELRAEGAAVRDWAGWILTGDPE